MIFVESAKKPQTGEELRSELKRIDQGIALRKAVIADLENRKKIITKLLKAQADVA